MKIAPTRQDGSALTVADAQQQQLAALRSVPESIRELAVDDTSTQLLKQFVTPPRIKRVQKSSREQFVPRFSPGDMVALPLMQKIAGYIDGKQPAFFVTPIMMFPEWVCWNPLETQGTLKGVRDRTFDFKSDLALKARDAKRRKAEPCPEVPERNGKKLFLNYVEHLNYIFMIHGDNEFSGVPIAYSFERGEHWAGTSFNALIQQRRAPLWACNFQAVIRLRKNSDGDWYGIDMENPSFESGVSPWVTDDLLNQMKALHEEFKKNYEDRVLQVDYDDEALEAAAADAPKDAKGEF